jgi:transcriptional regulator NrdR family protein
MRCPHCSVHDSRVKKTTRPIDEGLAFGCLKKRERQCKECRRRFFTYEVHEEFFVKMQSVLTEASAPARRTLRTTAKVKPALRSSHV